MAWFPVKVLVGEVLLDVSGAPGGGDTWQPPAPGVLVLFREANVAIELYTDNGATYVAGFGTTVNTFDIIPVDNPSNVKIVNKDTTVQRRIKYALIVGVRA